VENGVMNNVLGSDAASKCKWCGLVASKEILCENNIIHLCDDCYNMYYVQSEYNSSCLDIIDMIRRRDYAAANNMLDELMTRLRCNDKDGWLVRTILKDRIDILLSQNRVQDVFGAYRVLFSKTLQAPDDALSRARYGRMSMLANLIRVQIGYAQVLIKEKMYKEALAEISRILDRLAGDVPPDALEIMLLAVRIASSSKHEIDHKYRSVMSGMLSRWGVEINTISSTVNEIGIAFEMAIQNHERGFVRYRIICENLDAAVKESANEAALDNIVHEYEKQEVVQSYREDAKEYLERLKKRILTEHTD
jgi:hypothetical protein